MFTLSRAQIRCTNVHERQYCMLI